MQEIILTLPYPPSVNHYKSVGRIIKTKKGGLYQKRINSVATKTFYYEVWLKIRSYMHLNRMETALDSTISLQVCIEQHPPDKRRRDVDNCIKIILDSLQRGGLIKDDNQISRLIVQKMDMIKGGEIIVKLREIL